MYLENYKMKYIYIYIYLCYYHLFISAYIEYEFYENNNTFIN